MLLQGIAVQLMDSVDQIFGNSQKFSKGHVLFVIFIALVFSLIFCCTWKTKCYEFSRDLKKKTFALNHFFGSLNQVSNKPKFCENNRSQVLYYTNVYLIATWMAFIVSL